MLGAAEWNTFEPPNKDELKVARVYVNYGIESGVNLEGALVRIANRRKFPVVAGDLVYTDGNTVEGVMPRGKVLARYAEESGIRLIASHLDQVGIVCSASDPPFQETFVDRYMVYCRIIDLPLFIIMNKMDEADPEIQKRLEPIQAAGVDVIFVSAISGRGFPELRKRLARGITVLSGMSGVGKSTIINRVLRDDEMIPTQELTKYGRGKHTTTAAEVYDFRETLLIDTPGIKIFGFLGVDPTQVQHGFPDILALSEKCEWGGCLHQREQGCAVRAAVEQGDLHPMRLRAYTEILEQVQDQQKPEY
ncbi:MAG: ribosome small subunit-dependent GTPase A [Candidatus Sumerlaeia bacterium]|nr:ribosome small subunit-dependent GTPase A [Candidatus Sumerlaeia bacterium]